MTVPIVLRAVKGTPLTNDEVDANFTNLKSAIDQYTAADVLIKIKTVDGTGSGLDADLLDGLNSSSSATASTIVARDASGNFSATTITANLTGNVTGNLTGSVTGNVTGSAGSVAYTGLTGGTPTWNQSTTGTAAGLSATLAIASGGTGAVNATNARANLAAATRGANSDITSLTGLTTPLTVAQGGTGASTLPANSVLTGNGTGAFQSVPPGSSGNLLTSNGLAWVSSSNPPPPPPFASGTVILFYNTNAPTGWTKLTTQNDKALRVVSGIGGVAGGTVAFTTAFASQAVVGDVQAHTLTVAEMPSHNHGVYGIVGGPGGSVAGPSDAAVTGNRGGSGGHTHPFSGTAINLAVQYVDVILCSKD